MNTDKNTAGILEDDTAFSNAMDFDERWLERHLCVVWRKASRSAFHQGTS